MGTFLDDLDDHEGYADRRLPNGQLAGGVWTHPTREFTAYVAVCGCGWQATGEHPPTEDGEETAVEQWRSEHARPRRARQPPGSPHHPGTGGRPRSTNGGLSTPSPSWPARRPAAAANWAGYWSGSPAAPAGGGAPPPPGACA